MLAAVRPLLALAVLALLAAAPAAQAAPAHPPAKTVDVKVVALNDFHGNLEPPSGSSGAVNGTPAGGVEYLATHVKALEAEAPRRSVVVSAGDLIGASPLLSALFHDEPTIEAFNEVGLDFNAVGNHEFDEGAAELLRMQKGGCHPVDGCQDGTPFRGARFKFLAANVDTTLSSYRTWRQSTLFPPYAIKRFGNVKVAFIGMTLKETPTIVSPSGIVGLQFKDEADTVNALVPKLRRQGVKAIVVLLHQGGAQTGTPVDPNGCTGVADPIASIVSRTSKDVDLFVTGHTHQAYNCLIDGRAVTSASSFGRLITDIDLTIDRRTKDVVKVTADNKVVTRDVAPDPAETALIQKYKTLAEPIANRVIGSASADLVRAQNAAGESPLGDLIADSQLAATDDENGAVAAFMNPGGIRADILAGEVTYAEAFTVQPFGNVLTTLTLTGEQLRTMLEQQWSGGNEAAPKVLQVSSSVAYTWDPAKPAGSRVGPIAINGVPVTPSGSYRITVNSFLADGGDGFTVLTQGTDRIGGGVDVDAFAASFAAGPLAPPALTRITQATF